jgi:hypothetical protein
MNCNGRWKENLAIKQSSISTIYKKRFKKRQEKLNRKKDMSSSILVMRNNSNTLLKNSCFEKSVLLSPLF